MKRMVYEFSYLGQYYYTNNDPSTWDKGTGLHMVTVIRDLNSSRPIDKRTIAKQLEIKSTELTVIREKKK